MAFTQQPSLLCDNSDTPISCTEIRPARKTNIFKQHVIQKFCTIKKTLNSIQQKYIHSKTNQFLSTIHRFQYPLTPIRIKKIQFPNTVRNNQVILKKIEHLPNSTYVNNSTMNISTDLKSVKTFGCHRAIKTIKINLNLNKNLKLK